MDVLPLAAIEIFWLDDPQSCSIVIALCDYQNSQCDVLLFLCESDAYIGLSFSACLLA